MSVLPSQPLRKVTSSCALPSGGTLNLSHTPWPSLSLISAACRLLRRHTRLTLALFPLPRDFIDGAATAEGDDDAARDVPGLALRAALVVGFPPRNADDVGAKLDDRQQHHNSIMTTELVLRLLSLVEAPMVTIEIVRSVSFFSLCALDRPCQKQTSVG